MKKIFVLLMIGAFAASLITGCGSGDSETIAVCKKYSKAMQKGDYVAAAKFCTGEQAAFLDRLGRGLTEYSHSGDLVKEGTADAFKAAYKDCKYQFKQEFVDGSEVRVEVEEENVRDGNKRNVYWLLKKADSGEWKIYDEKEIFTGGDVITALNKSEIEKYYIPHPIKLHIPPGPLGKTVIMPSAFSGCTLISSVDFPAGCDIGEFAFSDCPNLQSVELPEGMTEIKKGVFKDCKNLQNVTIPKSVLRIGDEAFRGCDKLNTAIPEMTLVFGQRAFYLAGREGKISGFQLKKYTELGERAFAYSGVEVGHLEITEDVTIGSNAFGGIKVKSATISRKNITEGMLADCKIGKLSIKEGVTEIGPEAFYRMSFVGGPEDFVIPQSVNEIGKMAFCLTDIKSISMPPNVKKIEDGTFRWCRKLQSFTIPDGVTEIGKEAFEDCCALKEITIPSGVWKIGDSSFKGCTGLRSVVIPGGVKEMGIGVFEKCSGLQSATVFSGKIGMEAFRDCTSLKNVTISDGVTKIGVRAFGGCTSLENVDIPKSVRDIDMDAFKNTGIKNVKLPKGVSGMISFDSDCRIEHYE